MELFFKSGYSMNNSQIFCVECIIFLCYPFNCTVTKRGNFMISHKKKIYAFSIISLLTFLFLAYSIISSRHNQFYSFDSQEPEQSVQAFQPEPQDKPIEENTETVIESDKENTKDNEIKISDQSEQTKTKNSQNPAENKVLQNNTKNKNEVKSSESSKTSNNTYNSNPPTNSNNNASSNTAVPSIGKYIVGYYGSWANYSGYTANSIPASKLTHVNYAFAKINPDYTISLVNYSNDVNNISSLNSLKNKNNKLKIILSIGGWDYSTYFSSAAASPQSREVFAQSCLDTILNLGMDGVDIDWEYPVSGGSSGTIHSSSDKQNFTALLQTIRNKFDSQSSKDGKKYYLTIAGALGSYLNKIEANKISSIVDYIFIMAYDIHGSWDKYADFNAPLYNVTGSPSDQYQTSVYTSVKEYLNAGVPNSKLVLGMPFYGNAYTVSSSNNNGLFNTFTSVKSLAYKSIVSSYLSNPLFSVFFDTATKVPYLFGNNTFISYDNEQSISEKAKLAKNFNLAGVGAWELSQDFNSTLLSSAYNNFIK